MIFTIFSIFYVLIAAAMIILILMQRGAGADAGSGFGGGASATVFGARGSSSFLTRATAFLAGLFFLLSLGMAMYLGGARGPAKPDADLGIMAGATEVPQAAASIDTSQVPKASQPPAAASVPASAGSGSPDVPRKETPAKEPPAPPNNN